MTRTKRFSPLARRLRIEPLEDRRLLTTITVDTLLDEDDGIGVGLGGISLRDAIGAASTGDTIDFSVTGVINLEHGELVTTDVLTINGPGPELLTIDAQQNSRVFNITGRFSEFAISGLTLTGGRTTGEGGAIGSSDSDVTLTNSTVSGNFAKNGGGIWTFFGDVTLINSTVSGNTAFEEYVDGNGGGISVYAADVTLTNSRVTRNTALFYGGGISVISGNVTLTNSTVSGNSAIRYGGGGIAFPYAISDFGRVTLTNSTISGNSAGSDGGGIFSDRGRTVTVTGSTVSGNSARSGGAIKIYDDGNVTVTNSTITGNTAENVGGISVEQSVTVVNSIVAGNSANNEFQDVEVEEGTTLANFSLIGDASGTDLTPTGSTPDADGNLIGSETNPIDPMFVRNPNAGPDEIWGTEDDDPGDLRLRVGSLGIDAGSNALAVDPDGNPLTTDLLGNPRILDGDGNGEATVDMGAYEFLYTDLNRDGWVGLHELAIIQQNIGTTGTATYAQGDLNRDQAVDRSDLAILVKNYGQGFVPTTPQPTAQAAAAVVIGATADRSGAARGVSIALSDAGEDEGGIRRRTTRVRVAAARTDTRIVGAALDNLLAGYRPDSQTGRSNIRSLRASRGGRSVARESDPNCSPCDE